MFRVCASSPCHRPRSKNSILRLLETTPFRRLVSLEHTHEVHHGFLLVWKSFSHQPVLSLQLPFALAQHQRLALAPETFTLTGKGKVLNNCRSLLPHLHIYASNSFVPYTQVINEGAAAKVRVGSAAPIPLQTAIARGIISIEGSAVAKVEGRTIAAGPG